MQSLSGSDIGCWTRQEAKGIGGRQWRDEKGRRRNANSKGERPMYARFVRIRRLLLGPKALGPKAKFVWVRHRLLEKARGKGQRRAAMVQRKRQGKGTIEAKAPLWRLVKGEGPMKATGTKAGQRPNGEGGQRQSSCPPLCLAMCRYTDSLIRLLL